uniref:hairy-related 11 n=1 Tax=Centroberyx gerrardi TaxID=166262 RepID=UPI003AAC5164
MTRKLQSPDLDNAKSRKRILKPVVEKKRRDRINQSLGELRTLLLNYTSDVRLQNPKIEKAEILDLAVEYLQKWTDRKSMSNGCLPHSPALFTIENAGFQQCVTQLTSYMHKITPAQRVSLIQELRSHMESQCSPSDPKPGQHSSSSVTDFNQRAAETQKGPDAASVDEMVRNSKRKQESPELILLSHHSSCQPGTLSPTICHGYLSPPISPYLSSSSSSSAYLTPPPFPSLACHFSFPPSLSPLSSSTSFSTPPQSLPTMPAPVSFSPTLPLPASPTFHFPSLTALRSPLPAPREGLPANSSSSVWRPWF